MKKSVLIVVLISVILLVSFVSAYRLSFHSMYERYYCDYCGGSDPEPEILIIQPDADIGKDGYIRQDDETKCFGTSNTVDAGLNWQNSARRGLLEFDICEIPANAVINNVELKLYLSGGTNSDQIINVHKLIQQWDEGTTGYNDNGATWETYNGASNWVTFGGDFDSDVSASLVVGAKNNYYNWDVTDLVRDWYGGENSGLILKGEDETGDVNRLKRFKSSDDGTVEQRPQLIINYTGGSGEWCEEPEPPVIPTWHIQYNPTPTDPQADVEYWNLDLFDVPSEDMQDLSSQGTFVMCYFSAGSWEDWRPDADDFPESCKGNNNGWPGEKWLDTRCPEVRAIMAARMNLGVQKGCDGFDPDNMDGYDNNPGFPLTEQDAIDYYNFLANYSHYLGKEIGLKNSVDLIDDVLPNMDWAVNEECYRWSECSVLNQVLEDDKLVFHIEYPYGGMDAQELADNICAQSNEQGFATLIKNLDLDEFEISCKTWT